MVNGKKVVITGATGMIGKKLCAQLALRDYQLVIFSRNPDQARTRVPGAAVRWTPTEEGAWASALDGAYGVIHLAGAPIFGKRWNEAYKQEIRDSRVTATRLLVQAMAAAQNKPAVFVCGSAIGYYGASDDTELDENAPPGNDFLAQVGVAWEQEGARAEEYGIRTTLVRTGIVLAAGEGALAQMVPPFQFFVGGPILPGRQWFSWIHLDDEVELMIRALEDPRCSGPLNATAPNPQTNRDFSATLGKVLGRPSWLPVPTFALNALFGELGTVLASGQRVIPRKALDLGYQFKYATSEPALRHLLAQRET
ncbi:MAG: TIGR01777 family protein [Chloroflexaceae bacterium]|nr:TIGR01777 family protein [Chloroflexaceae bacterium]